MGELARHHDPDQYQVGFSPTVPEIKGSACLALNG